MLTHSPLIAFVPTKDATWARHFYENVLGLGFVSDDSFAVVMDANGTMIRVVHVKGFTPFPFTILGWQVDDIHKSDRRVDEQWCAVYALRLLRAERRWGLDRSGRRPDCLVHGPRRQHSLDLAALKIQNSTLSPSCTCRSGDCPVAAAVNVPNGRTFNPSAATVAAF